MFLLLTIFVNGRISVDKTPSVVFVFLAVITLGIFFYIFSSNVYEVFVLSAVTGLSMGVVQPLLMTITNAIKKKMTKAYLTSMDEMTRPSTSTPKIRLSDSDAV